MGVFERLIAAKRDAEELKSGVDAKELWNISPHLLTTLQDF
jgi:hypothetical protein